MRVSSGPGSRTIVSPTGVRISFLLGEASGGVMGGGWLSTVCMCHMQAFRFLWSAGAPPEWKRGHEDVNETACGEYVGATANPKV